MVDLSGVGPLRSVGPATDRKVREAASQAPSKAQPFREQAPSQIVKLATQMAGEPPVVDKAKVEALRQALAKGELPIEPNEIADILLGKAE
jgi:flagellar biosynthesis anti-sigma factor FlgM